MSVCLHSNYNFSDRHINNSSNNRNTLISSAIPLSLIHSTNVSNTYSIPGISKGTGKQGLLRLYRFSKNLKGSKQFGLL